MRQVLNVVRKRFSPPLALAVVLACASATVAFATTPNPGHPWSQVGDGTFAVTGPTALRTYTFPDSDAIVLSGITGDNGGTGAGSLTGVILADAGVGPVMTSVSVLTAAHGGTGNGFTAFTGPSGSAKTFTLPDVSAVILTDNTDVTLAQGGTGASLTASNGGIFYSGASAAAILAGTGSAGRMLLSGASAAPSWSTATYPDTAGTAGEVLTSDGTNWVSTALGGSEKSVVTRGPMYTAAVTNTSRSSMQTTRIVGLFNVPETITVNQVSLNLNASSNPAGSIIVCVYTEDGSTKLIDESAGTAVGIMNFTVSPAITLDPGNYYIAVGCASNCGAKTFSTWTSTSLAAVNGTVPTGKKVYEGTVTHSSNVCNSTLGTITGAASATPIVRLDN